MRGWLPEWHRQVGSLSSVKHRLHQRTDPFRVAFMKTDPLRNLALSFRCPMNWEDMKGDGTMRFCEQCRKHVHNLEAYTEAEARELVCGGNACVRFRQDENGRVVTKTLLAVAAAAATALSSCAHKPEPEPLLGVPLPPELSDAP
jgi:hypothetical protein